VSVLGNKTLSFSWPSNYLGSVLQSNSINIAITNDWVNVPGSSNVTSLTNIPILTNGNVFYRLVTP
jgi:hypothetical protein